MAAAPGGHSGLGSPSPWLLRWAHVLPTAGRALDLACGSGRHVLWLAARGLAVTGVDRDALALSGLADLGPAVERIEADIEAGPWPLAGRLFDTVLVTNYLWRPLLPHIAASLAPGGVLVYETFADGHQHVGRPSRPDFLLQRGELLRAFEGLRVVAFEDGWLTDPERCVQRLVAVRDAGGPPGAATPERRWALAGPGS